jgi:hypothetical protein
MIKKKLKKKVLKQPRNVKFTLEIRISIQSLLIRRPDKEPVSILYICRSTGHVLDRENTYNFQKTFLCTYYRGCDYLKKMY